MFVIYKVVLEDGFKRERVKEFQTLEEAEEYLYEHRGEKDLYTVVMES